MSEEAEGKMCNMFNMALWKSLGLASRGRGFQSLAMTLLVLTSSVSAAASATDPAAKVVEKIHAELLTVMKQAKTLGYKGRYQRLAPVVASSYDLPFISKVVVGRYWNKFRPEQQEQFVKTFTNLSIATYANQFNGYSGERFKTISAEESKRGRILIKTVLIKSNGEEVELDYILHQNKHQWQIINVIAQGVSDLSLKRAQYTSYLKKNSFDALLQKINNKIKSYEG
jgi:phospholipid transport system substrate-binding protein